MANFQPTTSCERCGYDLRGIAGKLCPECGAPQDFIIIRISDPRQFHFARAALESENLLGRFINPGGPMGISGEVVSDRSGWVWVRCDAADRAEEIFDELGIVTSLGARPIVDRAEPRCPKCNADLEVNGPEVCPNCNTPFEWVEIGNEPFSPAGQVCHRCGYELTGNTSGSCPECGAVVVAHLYETQEPDRCPPVPITEESKRMDRNLFSHAMGLCSAMFFLILLSLLQIRTEMRIALRVVAFLALLYCMVGLVLNVRHRAKRS